MSPKTEWWLVAGILAGYGVMLITTGTMTPGLAVVGVVDAVLIWLLLL